MSAHRVTLLFSADELCVRQLGASHVDGAEVYPSGHASLVVARFADAIAAYEYLDLLEQTHGYARAFELRTERGLPLRTVGSGRDFS